jgi:2-hydroxychromene-2-carboxylate isomerase
MSSTIRFYFDYVSPNAYLAWTQLPTIAEKYAFTVEPVPVLFAGPLEAHGQLGPAEVPAKLRWMSKNNLRKAALRRVVMNPPAFHPINSVLALRVSSLPLETADRWALIDALFQAVWVRGLHVSEAAVVEKIARGVFGVPTMEVGNELFWGYDDFPHFELFLAGKDPLDPTEWQKWSALPRPSAVRARVRSKNADA